MKRLLLTSLGALCFGSFAIAQEPAKTAQKKATQKAAIALTQESDKKQTSQAERQKAKEADYARIQKAASQDANKQPSEKAGQ